MESISDLQIWNNAAFEDFSGAWGSSKPIFADAPLDLVSGKENQSTESDNRSIQSLRCAPFKELNGNGVSVASTIDEEIEEIESEISRLSSRLKDLKLQKAAEKKVSSEKKKIPEEIPVKCSSNRKQAPRRGMSLGPIEILSGARRRGMSMGPSEILSSKSTISTTPAQNRRKSCLFKLPEINEEEDAAVGRKLFTASPKRSKNAIAAIPTRQATTAMTTRRKNTKKEDAAIQPKKLFTDVEKAAVSNKKQQPISSRPPGRVVPSRYASSSAIKQRSLPENDQERVDKKRSLPCNNNNNNNNNIQSSSGASRVKKRWEIPSQIVVHASCLEAEEKSPDVVLPKIRIAQRKQHSPRDSGPAKRVAELICRRKSFFGAADVDEDDDDLHLYQALSYQEEDDEKKLDG